MGIVDFSLSVSLFVFVVVMLRVAVGFRLPKMTFRVLWIVVMIMLLIPINIPSRFSIFNLWEQQRADLALATYEPIVPDVPTESVGGGSVIIVTPPNEIPAIAVPERPPIPPGAVEDTKSEYHANEFSIWDYLYYFLLAGSATVFLIALVLHFRQRQLYATSLPCNEDIVSKWQDSHKLKRQYSIRTLETITSPLTYGVIKPVILLPSTLDFEDESKVNCILYHEFIHVKRFDVLLKFLWLVALSVHWFNPLVWIAYVLMNRDIELSCDEEVVRRIGGESKSKYAELLLDLTQKRRTPLLLLNTFSANVTKERVRSIMKFKKTTIAGAITSMAVVGLTVAVFATSAMGSDPYVADESEAETTAPTIGTAIDAQQTTDTPATTAMSGTMVDNPATTEAPQMSDTFATTTMSGTTANPVTTDTPRTLDSSAIADEPTATDNPVTTAATVPSTPVSTVATMPRGSDELTVDVNAFVAHLRASGSYVPEQIILSPVGTYANGIAFYDITSQRIFERMWGEINGYTFVIDNPLLYFYAFETATIVSLSHELLELLSPEEFSDLHRRSQSEFHRIQNSDEFQRVQGGWSVEQWQRLQNGETVDEVLGRDTSFSGYMRDRLFG